jgi:hypothetical protein
MTGFSGLSVSPRVYGTLALFAALAVIPLSASADTFRIEIDYMVDTNHSHMPQPDEIAAVVQMFACEGHTLIIDVDDALTHNNVLIRDPSDNSFFDYNGVANSFGKIKDDFFDRDGVAGWHYCVFGHQYEDSIGTTTTSSGIGQVNGILFLVSLGAFVDPATGDANGTPFERASTLAHEFGHNLGLSHCGSMNCGDATLTSYVGSGTPIIPSIMSYQYQLAGVREQTRALGLAHPDATILKELDYSRGRLCTISESALDESFGVGMFGVDWDCSGMVSGVVTQNLMSEGSSDSWCNNAGSTNQTISDYREWDMIASSASPELFAVSGNTPQEIMCITKEEKDLIFSTQGIQQPTLQVESCRSGKLVFVDPDTTIPELATGSCFQPVSAIDQAVNFFSPDGSEMYLKAAQYPIGTGPLVINRPLTIFSTGSAVIK